MNILLGIIFVKYIVCFICVLYTLCWVHCVGYVVLGTLCWVRCVGYVVLGTLCIAWRENIDCIMKRVL